MQAFLNEAPLLFFAVSEEGLIIEANAALCKAVGYSASELTGHPADRIYTLATRIFQQTHLMPLLRLKGLAEEIYITLRAADGQDVPVLLNAERKRSAEGAVSLYAGIIVRNRKQYEEELIAARRAAETALSENTVLAQAKAELQQHKEALDHQLQLVSNRNEELRQFNRVVTHDIQEPLRKLSVFSGMLQECTDKDEQLRLVQKTRKVMEEMKVIVSGLQQYVWLNETPPAPAPVSFQALVESVRQQLLQENPGCSLQIRFEGEGSLTADPDQLRLLFYQLLSNALRFRKGDGAQVRIHTDTLRRNSFRNLPDQYHYVAYRRLILTDQGLGVDPAYRLQAFELFKRLHANSGRGVGLALCKKIVENHQGTIDLEGKVGEGTTVTILLPLKELPGENIQDHKPFSQYAK
jgi:sigma-B regulation protein RsbU (phosphoserine phosphatase)